MNRRSTRGGLAMKFARVLGCFFILIATLGHVSCASLSKEQCLAMNWSEQGRIDGIQGKTATTFAEHSKACASHGVTADQKLYELGRDEGLTTYCTYESGYEAGLKGRLYQGVCVASTEAEFLKGYKLGTKEYELGKREDEIRKKEDALKARQSILSEFKSKECSFNSDCKVKDACTFRKCARSGKDCAFDSDCETDGICSMESKSINGVYTTVRVCKYL